MVTLRTFKCVFNSINPLQYTYVSVQLLGRIDAQGRNVQDMILIGLTSGSGDATEQKIRGRINIRLFTRPHSVTKWEHPLLIGYKRLLLHRLVFQINLFYLLSHKIFLQSTELSVDSFKVDAFAVYSYKSPEY